MKIIALQAENLKRLVAVEIKPDGNLVEITGKNGQGKTSVLDAIWWALEGATHIQAAPIRKGATEALIRLDLGELKVTRKFRAKEDGGYTTTITVEGANGMRAAQPQQMLDSLVGALSFDPLAFTRMKPKDQLETLRGFVPGVDFEAIDAAYASDFAKRTEANREAKTLRAQADGIVVPGGIPDEPIDEAALVAELENAGRHNSEREQRIARREQAAGDCARLEKEALDLKAKADALYKESAEKVAAAADLKSKLLEAPPLPEAIDTAALTAKIGVARVANGHVANAKRKAGLLAEARIRENLSKTLTEEMAKREKEKADAIASAKMPVPGVSFGDGVVLLDGVPFEQASDAQQLQASIAIAAAMNPKLQVIRVRDGSLLDDDAMKLLAKFADEHDLQVWIERVDSSGAVGFVLEDGHVRRAGADKAEAA